MADEVVKEIKDAGGRAVANYDSRRRARGRREHHQDRDRRVRQGRRRGEQRGHPARRHLPQDGVRELGRRAQGAPLRRLQRDPRGVAALPREQLRPRRRRHLHQRPVRQLRPGQLRRRQARPRRPDQHAGPGGREVQHQGQRRRADRRHPDDAGHPAAGGVREAHARSTSRRWWPTCAPKKCPTPRRCSSSAAARCSAPRCSRTRASRSPRCPSVDDVAAKWGEITDLSAAQRATFSLG